MRYLSKTVYVKIDSMKYLILFTLSSYIGLSQQRSEAFLIDIFDRKVKVVSPKKVSQKMHAIFTNNTLSRILGKVMLHTGEVISFVTLEAGQSKSVHIGIYKEKKIFFIPLAPSLQEIELIVGRSPYEIPPKN